ncbi:MAG TPA: SCO1664 family protein [Actinomycetota bacterium]
MTTALAGGDLEVLGLLPGASNHTFLGRIGGIHVVYKPIRGEAPLWDFPIGTLAAREVAAARLAQALGWPNVPSTVMRDGPAGPGAVQEYVLAVEGEHYFTLRGERADELRAVAAFDVVANNADRKGGHLLLGEDGRLWCIDHGLTFHAEPKLRTVIWDFAGEPLPGGLAEDLERVVGELRGGPLREGLEGLLDPTEVGAAGARAEALLRAGRFPGPGPGRPVPWPLV